MATQDAREPDETSESNTASAGLSAKPALVGAPLAFESPDYRAMNDQISETRKQSGPELDDLIEGAETTASSDSDDTDAEVLPTDPF